MLTSDAQHGNVFPEVSILGFKRGEGGSLEDLLVRAKVLAEKETFWEFRSCQVKRCKVCTFLEEKNTFTNKNGGDTYNIMENLDLNRNSENVIIYLIACKKCKKQFAGL